MARILRLPPLRDSIKHDDAQETLTVLLAPTRWDRRVRSPELKEALGSVQAATEEARRLLALPERDAPLRTKETLESLRDLLARGPEDRSIDSAWDLAASLRALLPMLGDYPYVSNLLEVEAVQASDERPQSWSSYFELDELNRLRHEYQTGAPDLTTHMNVVHRLSLLSSFRAADDRARRARVSAKLRYLEVASPLLLTLLLTFVFVVDEVVAGETWKSLALVAAAGALGGALGGLLRARDRPIRVEALRLVWPAARLQPLIGAAAGLFVFLILESGFLSGVIAQTDTGEGVTRPWSADTLLAFTAGFSEPFFLGLVRRIGGAALDEPSKS